MVESRTYSILYFKSSNEATAFYNQFFATLPYLHGSQPIVTILLNVVQHINSCHLPTSLGGFKCQIFRNGVPISDNALSSKGRRQCQEVVRFPAFFFESESVYNWKRTETTEKIVKRNYVKRRVLQFYIPVKKGS